MGTMNATIISTHISHLPLPSLFTLPSFLQLLGVFWPIGMPDSNFICLTKQTMVQERGIGQPMVHTFVMQPMSTGRAHGPHIRMLLLLSRGIFRAGFSFGKKVWESKLLASLTDLCRQADDILLYQELYSSKERWLCSLGDLTGE